MSTPANSEEQRDSLGFLALYLADDEARYELADLAGPRLLDTLAEMLVSTYEKAGYELADLLPFWRQNVEEIAAKTEGRT